VTEQERIDAFLAGARFAVVGASRDRAKYGNKVLRAYRQNDREVVAVNPNADEIENVRSYPSLAALPAGVHGVSIITPPPVTAAVIDEAVALGIGHLWLQPGAEDDEAIERARAAGVNIIAHGPCALVVMGYRESAG
jgi:predicted CoA-binding protein